MTSVERQYQNELDLVLSELQEAQLQLSLVCEWLESQAHKYCRCENNGDYCAFHAMLDDARKAIQ